MKLVTFNILHGRTPGEDVDLGRFAQCVADLDADILALQEVDAVQPRSGMADLTALAAEAMGARSHQFVERCRHVSAIQHWYLVPLSSERAIDSNELKSKFSDSSSTTICSDMNSAIQKSLALKDIERVVIFGSFYTIADATLVVDKM